MSLSWAGYTTYSMWTASPSPLYTMASLLLHSGHMPHIVLDSVSFFSCIVSFFNLIIISLTLKPKSCSQICHILLLVGTGKWYSYSNMVAPDFCMWSFPKLFKKYGCPEIHSVDLVGFESTELCLPLKGWDQRCVCHLVCATLCVPPCPLLLFISETTSHCAVRLAFNLFHSSGKPWTYKIFLSQRPK